jgi:hypothetical protein
MRFQRKKKGEEQRKARGVTPPCPHTPFNLPRNIPGSGVIRRMIGACFSHRLFSFLFSFSFFFRESSRATQHSKNVQGVPSGSNAASGYLWTHRPTELPSLLFTFVCIILTLLMKKNDKTSQTLITSVYSLRPKISLQLVLCTISKNKSSFCISRCQTSLTLTKHIQN